MADRKLAKSLQNILLDFLCILVGVVDVIINGSGREIRAVDRVVNRDRDFILGIVVDNRTGDSCPHGLHRGAESLVRSR